MLAILILYASNLINQTNIGKKLRIHPTFLVGDVARISGFPRKWLRKSASIEILEDLEKLSGGNRTRRRLRFERDGN